jgi:hypothetical protein
MTTDKIFQGLRDGATAALKAAHRDRQALVPVLGAGVSVPLGLPSWSQLVLSFQKLHGLQGDTRLPINQLTEIKLKIGEANFIRLLQEELTIEKDVTTVTLQALALTAIERIVTTNLDHAVEQAYALTGRPLDPGAVFVGSSIDELTAFRDAREVPKLLKLHGSLERPSSWILTADQYKQVYVKDGSVRELWSHIGIPFFIGFSFSDPDVGFALRQAMKWDVKSYAAMPIDEVIDRREELADHNVIPIAFDKFEYLPEIIDQVFGCRSIVDDALTVQAHDKTWVKIGAARVEVARNFISTSPPLEIIQNAIEPRPTRSLVDSSARRQTGEKKRYLAQLTILLSERPGSKQRQATADGNHEIAAVLSSFARFPDILYENVLPAILSDWDGKRFFALSVILRELNGRMRRHYIEYLISQLNNQKWEPRSLRNISRLLALDRAHPAMGEFPDVKKVGNLITTTYPLTQHQVHNLLGNKLPTGGQAIKPYTIKSWSEVEPILIKLSERDPGSRRWRLPNRSEWISFATCCGRDKWPWGAERLDRRAAHLQFSGRQSPEEGVMEVGCFPAGQTKDGLLDLIGNAYELLIDHDEKWLAGWSWATRASEGLQFHPDKLIKWPTKGSNNVSLRPVAGASQ